MTDPYALPQALPAPAEPQRPAWRTAVGLLLALPAFVLLLTSYVEPLIWTVRSSFRNATLLDGKAESVGFDNYGAVADAGLGGAFGRALLLALVPLLIVLLLAPVLAWLAHRGGVPGRWAARALLALPLAAYAPTAAAAGPIASAAEGRTEPPSALAVYWLTAFGLAAALSVTLYLAALRRRGVPALLVAGGIAALTVVALALQSFTVPAVVRGASRDDNVPATLMYQQGFLAARVGTAAAVSTVLLIVLLVLGAAATLLLILSRTRLEFDDERPAGGAFPAGVSPMYAFAAIAGVLALIVLVVSVLGLGGWLTRSTESFESGGQEGNVGVNTWLPPLVGALIGVTVAALAAVGISGLRPLGRHSEWLLAPFGLFLFVGITPLALRAFESTRSGDRLGTFIGLIPPGSSVAIPALFVLALLVRGQLERRATAAARGEPLPWLRTVLGAAPMLLLAYLVTWIVAAQDLMWGLLAGGHHFDAQVLMLQALGARAFAGRDLPFSSVLPLWALILLFLLTLAAQLVYLDRVALRTGRRPD
ncbi:sugar ABC transporter permease [Dactylosporangium sp. CA-139066]|uniref:sugar ABC transporter permease n=1 Tax=Dactylosporangium sp. CA-139066 TaxID=3239930 RepID=UPI003D8D1A76